MKWLCSLLWYGNVEGAKKLTLSAEKIYYYLDWKKP